MKDILWDQIMVRDFESLACLSETERAVLHDWAFGKSVTQTAMNRTMCDTTVKDIRKKLRIKYDAVQIYSPLLPERRT